jgi:hypothetical protein
MKWSDRILRARVGRPGSGNAELAVNTGLVGVRGAEDEVIAVEISDGLRAALLDVLRDGGHVTACSLWEPHSNGNRFRERVCGWMLGRCLGRPNHLGVCQHS